jgi:hypothetical protein
MPGKIYLIHPNQKLEAMTEQAYVKEHIFQAPVNTFEWVIQEVVNFKP